MAKQLTQIVHNPKQEFHCTGCGQSKPRTLEYRSVLDGSSTPVRVGSTCVKALLQQGFTLAPARSPETPAQAERARAAHDMSARSEGKRVEPTAGPARLEGKRVEPPAEPIADVAQMLAAVISQIPPLGLAFGLLFFVGSHPSNGLVGRGVAAALGVATG